ncbi:MAG: PD-(D/E)XK nuclease family transposase [Lachnospiraceae bacterium]|nr:PD-(D/E)XK nuclease family transposase [Lachnospiraceae bacterium]
MNTTEQTHQQDLERLKSLSYMDDDFMTVCLADNFEGVELILQIVLGKKDIKIKSVRTQEVLKNLQGRSAILDVHAVDSDNKEFDVEIQRSDAGAGAKRARHNSSLLDAHILKSGEETEDIPDSYVIFITENDVMKGNQPIYPVERYVTIGEEKVLFGDGSHILYVNGKYRGDDEIGKLMHDFSCTEPDDMNFEELAGRARYFKKDEKGVKAMCKIMEDMRNEAELNKAKKTAVHLIKLGKMTLEEIAEATELSLDIVKELENKTMQLA